MIIKRLKLENMKCFLDREFELGRGLVVVSGPNESGKTTLHQAIFNALFEKGSANRKDLDMTASWGGTGNPCIIMDIDINGTEATLLKDYESRKSGLDLPETSITKHDAVDRWITDALGCPNQGLYEYTACISDAQLTIPTVEMGKGSAPAVRAVTERLQEVLTGTPAGSPAQVHKQISKRIDEISTTKKKSTPRGGKVESIKMELDDIGERLSLQRRSEADWETAKAELENVSERADHLSTEVSDLENALKNHGQFVDARNREKLASDKLGKLMEAEKLLDEVRSLDESLTGYSGYEKLAPRIEDLKRSASKREEAERRLSVLSVDKYERKTRAPSWSIALIVIGALAVAGGAVGWAILETWIYIALGGLVGVGLAAGGLFARMKSKSVEDARLAVIQKEMSEVEAKLTKLDREISDILSLCNRDTVQDCLSAYHEFTDLATKLQNHHQRINDLSGMDDPHELGQAIRDLSIERRTEQERLAELEPYHISDPVRYSSMEREAKTKRTELEKLEKRKNELKVRLSQSDFDRGEMIELEERRAELRRRLVHWERQLRIHQKALDVLQEAADTVMSRAGEVIEAEIGPIIKTITRGRYDKVTVGTDLSLSLARPGDDGWVNEKSMSLATLEQLHFAARLALVKLLTGGKHPPLILDDPFAHYDPERRRAAMKVVKEFSREYQVILFTPSPDYGEWADHEIRLEGPKGPDQSA